MFGLLFWVKWPCRACGALLKWEHSRALVGAVVFLIFGMVLVSIVGMPTVAVVIAVIAVIGVLIENRPEVAHGPGRCLRCGLAMDGPACKACGWLAS